MNAFLTWLESGTIIAFGFYLWRFGGRFLQAGMNVSCCNLIEPFSARASSAVNRRESLEALPNLGSVFGPLTVLLGIGAFVGLIAPGLSYALLVSMLAVTTLVAYVRIRRPAMRRRIAVLQPRPVLQLPLWCYAVTITAIVLIPVARMGRLTGADALVVVSALTILVFAILVEHLPALITGDDAEADLYVDNRLRRSRALIMLHYALAASFVYISWDVSRAHTLLSGLAQVGATGCWFTLYLWWMSSLRRRSSAAEFSTP